MLNIEEERLREAIDKIDQSNFKADVKGSLLHLFFDIALLVITLLAIHHFLSNEHYVVSVLLALFAGNLFFALFVIGHDCGHGSFSHNKTVNHLIGFILHHFLLTPYWAWKKSHQRHHQYPGNIEKDESLVPFTKDDVTSFLGVKEKNRLSFVKVRLFNLITFLTGINFHIYTLYNPRTKCSHFMPNEVFLSRKDNRWIYFGTFVSLLFFTLLLYLTIQYPLEMLLIYWLPFMVCFHLMGLVTLMQHHDFDAKWYYSQDWNRVKGVLNTFDYRYGALNFVVSRLHHNIANFHFIHHLFPLIPHYKLEAATKSLIADLKTEYQPKRFSYLKYFRIILFCNFVDNKSAEQEVYPLRSFEKL